MGHFAVSAPLFTLAEKPVHLCDDLFQFPGVPFIQGTFLKLAPTFGSPEVSGGPDPPTFGFGTGAPGRLQQSLAHDAGPARAHLFTDTGPTR